MTRPGCVVRRCAAEESSITSLWGRRICYRHLALYTDWKGSPKDRAPTREEWEGFHVHLDALAREEGEGDTDPALPTQP